MLYELRLHRNDGLIRFSMEKNVFKILFYDILRLLVRDGVATQVNCGWLL